MKIKTFLMIIIIFGCKNKSDPLVTFVDCLGVINGNALEDTCGECDANFENDCIECVNLLEYKQSTQQAFYYFMDVTINGIQIDSNDWVGAFNNDICVGAYEWDVSTCGNGICSVPVMGSDGNSYTEGYILPNQRPSFKIYDVSADTLYNTIVRDTTGTIVEIREFNNYASPFYKGLESTTAIPCRE